MNERFEKPGRLSVAPMMKRTDRHFRVFIRGLTRKTLLYTEMRSINAVLHGDREKLLGFSPVEHPIALQLGGDDPETAAEAAKIAADWGYDEVNLNVGCPSERVQKGNFGARLMLDPERVARCVAAMASAVSIPVTVKHRIGVDDHDDYDFMSSFVDRVADAGGQRFIVHARKAWLDGLSPKENRTVPPLRYDAVYRLKADRPELCIDINGGITTLAQALDHLEQVDGAMIGRAAYDDPYLFAHADSLVFTALGESVSPELGGEPPRGPGITRKEALRAFLPYLEEWLAKGVPLHRLSSHFVHLFKGQPGTTLWKRVLADKAARVGAGLEVIEEAMAQVGEGT